MQPTQILKNRNHSEIKKKLEADNIEEPNWYAIFKGDTDIME